MHGGDVVLTLVAHREPSVLGLARQSVLEDDHGRHDLGALQVRDVVALDAQRRRGKIERLLDLLQRLAASREVARTVHLVPCHRLLGVLLHGGHQGLLVASLGHPDLHGPPAPLRQQLGDDLVISRKSRHQHLARNGGRHGAFVEGHEGSLDQLGEGGLVGLVGHPPALPANATAADREDLHRHLEGIVDEAEHVGVRAVAEDDGLLLEHPVEGAEVVAELGRELVLLRLGRRTHALLDALGETCCLPAHEGQEVVDDLAVLVDVDSSDARRGALADVTQQTGPIDRLGSAEDSCRAGPHRKHPEQGVDGVADGPGVAVRPEVPDPLALGAAHDGDSRKLLADRDGEPWVGLVVAVLDVEPWIELLDPRVLQCQRLDLGVDDGPLHRRRGGDHLLRAGVQVGDVLEVRAESRAQRLGLAHVDDPALGVAKAVDPRLGRDLSRFRSIAGGIGHDVSGWRGSGGAGSGGPGRPRWHPR